MRSAEVLRVAWEGLTTNKVRSLLTMLGVIIGVAAVIIMMAVSAGTEATIAEQINGLGANLIFVSPSMARGGPRPGRVPDRARRWSTTTPRPSPTSPRWSDGRWSSRPARRPSTAT